MMMKIKFFLSGKFIMTAILVLLPISGSGGGIGGVFTNPIGALVSYVTQPSIDNLDGMLDARGRALILEARTQLDNALSARLDDLDKWSRLTIAEASAKIKLATNDAENNLVRIIDARALQFQEDLYKQQGTFNRNLLHTISILQASLLIVMASAAVFACLVHFGFRITTKNRGKKISYWSSAVMIFSIFITLVVLMKIGGWYIQQSAIKTERIELAKALSPNVRDFDLAAFRAKQIVLLSAPDSKEEAEAEISYEKYAIIQRFFNQRYTFESTSDFLDFSSRLKAAIQNTLVTDKKIDKDLMAILAIITFDNLRRTRTDEFIGAQLAATAISTGGATPLWKSTFEGPVQAVIRRYLTRPLTVEEMTTFFPENAKILRENIPAMKIVDPIVLNSLPGKAESVNDSLSALVRNHLLDTSSLYFKVVDWNLHTPSNGSGQRNGQQQLISDIEANHAAWIHILDSDAYKSASLAEKIKLLTLQYAISARLSDYKESLKNNSLKQDIDGFTCKSSVARIPKEILRSPDTRSVDRRLPAPSNSSPFIEETINHLIKDGSLTALSGFAASRTLQDATGVLSEYLYSMERYLYVSTKKIGDADINCDLLPGNYQCPPLKVEFPILRGQFFLFPVKECIPEEAKIKYQKDDIESGLKNFLTYSASAGLVACSTEKCNSSQDYLPVFRLIQNRNSDSLKNIETEKLYQQYSNALWAGTF
nr:hypothetical protein [Pantoea cypripedii]